MPSGVADIAARSKRREVTEPAQYDAQCLLHRERLATDDFVGGSRRLIGLATMLGVGRAGEYRSRANEADGVVLADLLRKGLAEFAGEPSPVGQSRSRVEGPVAPDVVR